MQSLRSRLCAVGLSCFLILGLAGCGVTITSVTLPQTVTLEKGETLQLEVNCGTENEADAEAIAQAAERLEWTWTSSDEAVVTVDESGLLTALDAGEADVTVSKADGGLSGSCHVTVVVTATGVTAPASLELETNGQQTAALGAKATPEDATGITLAYESSDPAVATVDAEGVVTAVANGEADITTTLNQAATPESAEPRTYKETTHVVVTTRVEEIRLDNTEGILTIGNSHTIQAMVEPENASDQNLTWASSDENVATVDETGKITAKAVGNATITANAGNVSATYEVTVQQITCSYCGATGHTSSSCPVKAADQKAAAQAAAEAAAQQQAAAAAAAQQQAAAQASGGGSTSTGGSSGGGTSAPAPAPDPGPSDSGGSSGGISHPEADIPGEIVTGGGNGVGVDAP